MDTPFADRLVALVEERQSQVCLGLDPILEARPEARPTGVRRASRRVCRASRSLIEGGPPACAKPSSPASSASARPGWAALERTVAAAREAGLLVIADGKRGDVPVSAAAYAQALFGSTPTPWGDVAGLGADAATVNPLLGADALEPLLDAAAEPRAPACSCLVRTSNPGAADLLDLRRPRRRCSSAWRRWWPSAPTAWSASAGCPAWGRWSGATEPRHLARLAS